MIKISKKAMSSVLYMILIGVVLFIIVTSALGSAFFKAFKSYKGAEESTDEIITAMKDVSNKSNSLALQLVSVNMEQNTAMMFFDKNTDLLMTYGTYSTNTRIDSKILLIRPDECDLTKQCVCLCKDFKMQTLSDGKNSDELNAKYAGKYSGVAPADIYKAECSRGLECTPLEGTAIAGRTTLSEVVGAKEAGRIDESVRIHGEGQRYIYVWEGGFALWRLSDKQDVKLMPDEFMPGAYVDLFIINNNVNIKFCLRQECTQGI